MRAEIRQCERTQKALAARMGRREITSDAFGHANLPLIADLKRLRVRG